MSNTKVELLESLRPDLIKAVDELDESVIKKFLKNGWVIDFPVTSTGISLYSMLMGLNYDIVEQV